MSAMGWLKAVSATLLSLALTAPVWSQEEPANPGLSTPAQATTDEAALAAAALRFDQIYQRWTQTSQQLETLGAELETASPARRTEIRELLLQNFRGLREMVGELRAAALDHYRLAPNQSESVQEILLRLAATDLYDDRIDQAQEIVALMLSKSTTYRGVNDLAGLISYCRDDFVSAKQFWQAASDQAAISNANAFLLQSIDQRIADFDSEMRIRAAEEGANSDLPVVEIRTSQGVVRVILYRNQAPIAVANFLARVDERFYDGLTWHDVIPGNFAQTGCPIGNGTGYGGESILSEAGKPEARKHFYGSLSMAIQDGKPDSASTQFFITFRPLPNLDGRNTVFGRVIEGHDVLQKLARVSPDQPGELAPDRIESAVVLRR